MSYADREQQVYYNTLRDQMRMFKDRMKIYFEEKKTPTFTKEAKRGFPKARSKPR